MKKKNSVLREEKNNKVRLREIQHTRGREARMKERTGGIENNTFRERKEKER